MRDAHVAEVQASGAAVDQHVGFHIFTTQKEVGKTGVVVLHTLPHSRAERSGEPCRVCTSPASTVPAIAHMQCRTKS